MELQPYVIGIFHVGLLALFLIIGKIIRVKFKLLQYLLLPSAAIGGLVAILVSPYTWGGVVDYPGVIENIYANFEEISIFLLNFVFAGMFIGRKIPDLKKSIKEAGPQIIMGQVLSWGQLLIPSLLVMLFLSRVFDVPDAFSTLAAIGFDGGASVAVGYTSTFQELGWYPEGVQLAIASGVVGILMGCILGVGLINWLVRRNHTEIADDPGDLPDHIRRGVLEKDDFKSAGTITVVPQSVEPIAIHFCLFGLAMVGGWGIVNVLSWLPGFLGTFFGYAPLFPFAMVIGMLIQISIDKIGLGHLVDRGLAERLQGMGLEFCILSVFASLNIPLILESSIPLAVILISAICWTLFSALYIAPRIMPDYWAERLLVDYGQSMGNVPVGMMLLRVVDPQFETPVLEAFSYKHTFHAPVFFSLLAFMPILANMLGVEFVFLISLAVIVFCLIVSRVLGYWGQGRVPVKREYKRLANLVGSLFN